jgi:predicted 3-demethylubiquinone-9 3-methyltransferase (glyoxalase superfamily)
VKRRIPLADSPDPSDKVPMQKITPFLWFDNQAEQAVKFYTSIFRNSKVGRILRYGEEAAKTSESGRPVGAVLTIEFEIQGQRFTALNGGPQFKFNESVSFVVNCETQEEVDYFWEKLTADGGQESACGWLKDKFGLSWQITPTVLIDMLNDEDPEKSERVMKAMLQMQKIDIKTLKHAYERQRRSCAASMRLADHAKS